MVELEKKLMEILELRKETFTGEDIKNVVDSILICKTYVEPVEVDPKAKTGKEIIQDWLGE